MAGRLDWSLQQVKLNLDVALLGERLGWRGERGYERMQSMPAQTVKDFLFIAQTERELAQEEPARNGR